MYKKVLIIAIAGIGDSLLFSPTLKLLAKKMPDTDFHVLVMFNSVADYFKRFTEIKKIHKFDFANKSKLEGISYIWKLKKEKFDLAINAYPSNRAEYNIISKFLAKKQIGHKYLHFNFGNLYFLNKIIVKEHLEDHPAKENLKLASALGITGETEENLLFPLLKEEKETAKKWILKNNLENKKIVGFHAGGGILKNHINKRWPVNSFIQLGKKLRDDLGFSILVFGGKQEENLINNICKGIGDSAFPIDDTSLGVSAAIVKECDMFVSNDTALMHISAAFKVPCVAIFGPTDVRKARPYNSPHIIATRNLKCSPCFHYSPTHVKCKFKTFECIRKLTVNSVFSSCQQLIKQENI